MRILHIVASPFGCNIYKPLAWRSHFGIGGILQSLSASGRVDTLKIFGPKALKKE
jgi:hypothetical protein